MSRLLAAFVGAVLAIAGAGKLTDWSNWRETARRQHVWSPIAIGIPPFELVLGAWLVAFEPSPVALGLATCLLLVFTVFLIAAIRSGSIEPCACFGARSSRPPRGRDVARNLVLISLLVASAVLAAP